MRFSLQNKKVWVAGHTGLAGSALVRVLADRGCDILAVPHGDLDLRRQADTERWISQARPDVVIVAAATVGGIEANRTRPAEFLYDNMMIAANIIHAAAASRVQKLLFMGSSCIYPAGAPLPLQPGSLLSGALETTNEAYAIAKIAGLKLCSYYRRQYGCDFISAMPCNLYGIGDRFDPVQSHVLPAMMMKFHKAALSGDDKVTLWGTGRPMREFLHADDMAQGCLHLLQSYSGEEPVNLGSGDEVSIRDIACLMAEVTGFDGRIDFDPSMPDGTYRKVMDSSIIRDMGWSPRISLREGLRQVYDWYRTKGMLNAA